MSTRAKFNRIVTPSSTEYCFKIPSGETLELLVPAFTGTDQRLRYDTNTKDRVFKRCSHEQLHRQVAFGQLDAFRDTEFGVEYASVGARYLAHRARETFASSPDVVTVAAGLFRKQRAAIDRTWWAELRFVSNDPKFDLPVFLIELVQLRFLCKSLKTHFKRIRKAFDRSGGKVRNLLDLFTGGWLDWSFGTGAFIRDLMKLWKLACNFEDSYQKFISGMGVVTSARKAKSLTYPLPLPEESSILEFGFNWHYRVRYEYEHSNVFEPYASLTARYRYFSSAMTGPYGKAKFLAQQFGVLWNPAIVWNLIPLSFIVDWAIPIGNWLESKRIDAVDLNVVIDEAGHGARLTLKRVYEVKPEGQVNWSHLCTERVRMYRRETANIESAPDTIKFGSLTMNKVLSGSSLLWTLVLSKAGKRKR